MDDHHVDLIIKNLVRLSESTLCSTKFLDELRSRRVLNLEDIDYVTYQPTHYKKSRSLYRILMGRYGAFDALLEALESTHQTGALMLLGKGNEKLNHQIEINPDHLFSIGVTYHGKYLALEKLLPFLTIADVENILKKSDCREELHYILKTNAKGFKIVSELPRPTSFYIPRHVSSFLTLNPKVFRVNSEDIFVFEGITYNELCDLVKPSPVEITTYIGKRSTCRHILLAKQEDWDNLVTSSSNPVHLIKANVQLDEYALVRTTSMTKLVWDYTCQRDKVKDAVMNENDIEKLIAKSEACAICVCDLPGMGKTWLLEKLAGKLNETFDTKKLVAFVRLSHFSLYLQDHDLFQSKGQSNLMDLVPTFFYFVCGSKLAASIVESGVLQKKLAMCLLLDGLDQMSPDHITLIIPLLEWLLTHEISLCITSRPHLRKQLGEISFVSYDLLPLSKEEQADYLVQSWQQNETMIDQSKLANFAKCLISTVSRQMGNTSFVETPFQIYALACIHKSAAQMYAGGTLPEVPTFHLDYMSSRTSLMDKLVKESASKLVDSLGMDTNSQIVQQLNHFHREKALKLVFSRVAYQLQELLASPENISMKGATLTEIYTFDTDSKDVIFTHRIFAEYFAAKFFYDFWTGNLDSSFSQHANFIATYFFTIVLGSVQHFKVDLFHINPNWEEIEFETRLFRNDSVLGFLNEMFHSSLSSTDIATFTGMDFKDIVKDGILFNAIFCSIVQDYKSIMMISKAVTAQLNRYDISQVLLAPTACFMLHKNNELMELEQWLSEYHKTASVSILTHWVVRYGSRSSAKYILDFMEITEGVVFSQLFMSLPSEMVSPITAAIRHNDLEMVVLVAEKLKNVSPVMIELCLAETYEMSETERGTRWEILKYLVGTDIEVLKIFPTRDCDMVGVSLVLLQFLADTFKFHWKQISSAAKLRLIQNVLLFYTDAEFKAIFGLLYSQERGHGSRSRGSDSGLGELRLNGVSLIPAVAFGKIEDISTFKLIFEEGGDIDETGCNGESLLHLACAAGKANVAAYLINKGICVNQKDNLGRTPLHYLSHVNPMDVTKALIDKDFDIMDVDLVYNNIAHAFASHPGVSFRLYQDWTILFYDQVHPLLEMKNIIANTPGDILCKRFGENVLQMQRDFQNIKLSHIEQQSCSLERDGIENAAVFMNYEEITAVDDEAFFEEEEKKESGNLHASFLKDKIVSLFSPEEPKYDTTIGFLKKQGEMKLSGILSNSAGRRNLKQKKSILYNTKVILGTNLRHTVCYLGTYNNQMPVCAKKFYCSTEWQDVLFGRISCFKTTQKHPNILWNICSEVINNSYLFLATELCSCSLQDNLQQQYFDYNKMDVVKQITTGLEYLHSINIAHGNMKPTNILFSFGNEVTPWRQVKIADGGMSTLIDHVDQCLNAATDMTGIVFWVGKEVLLHIDDNSTHSELHNKLEQTDIFSLGCLIYYILTSGEHPFGLGPKCGFNILNGNYKIESIRSEYPVLYELVKSMISSQKNERPSCPCILSHFR